MLLRYGRRRRRVKSPSVDWTALQTTLERTEADVLIALDCCCAPNAIEGGFQEDCPTEILAACCYNLTPRGEFTRAFIEQFRRRMLARAQNIFG
jgi:hypothetical protein